MAANSSTGNDTLAQLANLTINMFECDNDLNDVYMKHIPAALTTSKILSPIWWSIGIVGNILALLVWLQPKMRHSSGFYLAALAVSDIIFLVFRMVYEIHYIYNKDLLDKQVLCQWFPISFMSVQILSPLFVLAFTVERYLSVCHPFRMVNLHQSNHKVTMLVITGLTFLAFALSAIQGYFFTVEDGICNIRLVVSTSGLLARYSWTTEMLVFTAVPLAILCLNVLVILEVRNISNLEKQNMRIKSIDQRSTTVTLLGVSFYLILTIFPVTIIFVLYNTYSDKKLNLNLCLTDEEINDDAAWQSHLRYTSFKILIEAICQSHHMINFFIYLLMGKQFRVQLREMVIMFFCKRKLSHVAVSTNGLCNGTRTTRASVSSNRGSIGRGRLNGVVKCETDQCNNEKNGSCVYHVGEIEADSHIISNNAANMKLLTCEEESEVDLNE